MVAQNIRTRTARREQPAQPRELALRSTPPLDEAPSPRRPPRERAIAADEPAARPPVAQPAVDLDALTNHVIDQIDRRVVAWRERMGRV